jgi:uncharacterized membrane protein YgcG
VNWAPLILAVVFATPAVVMLLHRKAPRAVAILGALAALCIIAGVPSLLALIGHPLAPGPELLGIVAGALASGTFFYLMLRGHHREPLRVGRKAIGGGGGGPGGPGGQGGGGGRSSGHVRALAASVGLAVFGLMIAMNWNAVMAGVGTGFSQTVTTISHAKG